MKHSLELCKAGLHIKSWHDRNSSQFGCKCCGYIFESVTCPTCNSHQHLKQTVLNEVRCEKPGPFKTICGTKFFANLDLVDDDEPKSTLLEQVLDGEDKHEHPSGFRKGLINRDYQ